MLSDAGATTIVTALQATDYNKASAGRPRRPDPGRPAAVHRLRDAELREGQGGRGPAGARLRLRLRGHLVGRRRGRRRHPGQRCDRRRRWASACCPRAWPVAARGTAPTARASRSTRRSPRSCSPRPATSRASTRSSFVYDSTPEGEAAAEQRQLGYEEAGFSVKKYPYSAWQPVRRVDRPGQRAVQEDQPSRYRLVPGLAVGRRRSCRSSSARTTGSRQRLQHRRLLGAAGVDDEMERIKSLPVDEQADAWGELEQTVMTDFQPVINTGYYQNIFGFGTDIGGLRQRHLRRWRAGLPHDLRQVRDRRLAR